MAESLVGCKGIGYGETHINNVYPMQASRLCALPCGTVLLGLTYSDQKEDSCEEWENFFFSETFAGRGDLYSFECLPAVATIMVSPRKSDYRREER